MESLFIDSHYMEACSARSIPDVLQGDIDEAFGFKANNIITFGIGCLADASRQRKRKDDGTSLDET